MFVTTQGIVLQRVKFSDTSLIVKIFTRECGNQSFMIKGAFSKKSKQPASIFSALAMLDLTFNDSKKENLCYLKEVNINFPIHSIATDISKNCLLLFYQELFCKLFFENHVADVQLFDAISKHLKELEQIEPMPADFHLRFLVKLLTFLGYQPKLNFSLETPFFSLDSGQFEGIYFNSPIFLSRESSFYLFQLLKNNSVFTPHKNIRNELLDGIIFYLKLRNENFKSLESLEILRSVLHS